MDRLRRSERVALIAKELVERPNTLLPLGLFVERFGSSKPTISEDIGVLRRALAYDMLGQIETIPGAGGGVKYVPKLSEKSIAAHLEELSTVLSEPDRQLPGGFWYMTDVIFSTHWSAVIGQIFATIFGDMRPDTVVTMETKGIPLALMTARYLGCPLVVARKSSRVSEGPSVSINYVSGSDERMQSMSLPKRALSPGARCLVIDDFMRGGGTAQGIGQLLKEVGAKAVGYGVMMETELPRTKLVAQHVTLMRIKQIGPHASGPVQIEPGPHYSV